MILLLNASVVTIIILSILSVRDGFVLMISRSGIGIAVDSRVQDDDGCLVTTIILSRAKRIAGHGWCHGSWSLLSF